MPHEDDFALGDRTRVQFRLQFVQTLDRTIRLDLKAGTIDVARSWDLGEGCAADTKSRNRRRVPIIATLREHLAAERLRQLPGAELCFGLAPNRPFRVDRLQQRADDAWTKAKLDRLTLHDCRHTFASFAIAAGVNAKALSTYMGHSSVSITLDRYGHMMPGNEAEATVLLDRYLLTARSSS